MSRAPLAPLLLIARRPRGLAVLMLLAGAVRADRRRPTPLRSTWQMLANAVF